MRDFSEADRQKKRERIQKQEHPIEIPGGLIPRLEDAVRAALKGGYLSCPAAWKIAKNYDVPKVIIGIIADRIGIRITDCQLGCFKIEKTPYDKSTQDFIPVEVISQIEVSGKNGQLTCAAIFDLAGQYILKPITIVGEMGTRGLKIRECQLGCF